MKNLRRILTVWLLLAILTSCMCSANAVEETEAIPSPRSSAYFSSLSWDLTHEGGSTLRVYAKATATHVMTKLGAKSIALYEKRSGATSFSSVYVFNSVTAPTVLGTNKISHTFEGFYHKAVSKAQYYICVAFYAEDSAGDEYIYRYTPVITLP